MHSTQIPGASSERGVEDEPSRPGYAALLAQQTGALTRQQQFPDIFSYFCPTCLNIISILIFGTLPLQLIISQTSIYDHYFYSADE